MSTTLLILLTAAQEASAGATPPVPTSLSLDINQFVALVEKNHPEKTLDDLSLSRTAEAQKKAGALMDPEFAFGREDVPTKAMDQDSSEAMWKVTITQMFPWPGTLNHEEAAAEATTHRSQVNAKLSAVQRRLDAKDFYISLVAAAKLIDIERENLAETINILKNAEMRLKHGVGSHHDVIQAQNEKTLLSLNIGAMEADLRNLKDHAAQMIGRDDATGIVFALTVPSEYLLSAKTTAPAGEDITKEKLQATQSAVAAQLAAERKKSLPSFMTSGMLMQEDSGMRMYGLMAGVRVPLYSGSVRQGIAGEQAALARETAEELGWHDRKKKLARTQINRRRSAVEANLRGLRDEIVPNARQHLKTISTEYGQGKGSFAAVNTARKLLLRFEWAKILAERDVAMTTVSRERIEAGMVDQELDRPTPQLPSTDMAGGADMSGMGSSMGPGQMTPMSPAVKSAPKTPRRGVVPSDEDKEQGGKGGMNGMGGM